MRRNQTSLRVAVLGVLLGALAFTALPVAAQQFGVTGPSRTINTVPGFTRTATTSLDVYVPNTGANPLFKVCAASPCAAIPQLSVMDDMTVLKGRYMRFGSALTVDSYASGNFTLTPTTGNLVLNAPATYETNIPALATLNLSAVTHSTNAKQGFLPPQTAGAPAFVPTSLEGYFGYRADTDQLFVMGGAPAALTTRYLFDDSDTIGVANGGTGLTAGISGGLPTYTATGTLTSSALLTQYGVVLGGGAGAVVTTTANGTTGQVLTANTDAPPTWQAAAGGGTTIYDSGTPNIGMYVATGACAVGETITIGADIYEYDADGVAPCNGHICLLADASAVNCGAVLRTAINASGTEAYTAMATATAGSALIYGDTAATAAVATTDTVANGAWEDAGLGAVTAQGRVPAQRMIGTAYRTTTAAEAALDYMTVIFPFTPTVVTAITSRASYIKVYSITGGVVVLSIALLGVNDKIYVIAVE